MPVCKELAERALVTIVVCNGVKGADASHCCWSRQSRMQPTVVVDKVGVGRDGDTSDKVVLDEEAV